MDLYAANLRAEIDTLVEPIARAERIAELGCYYARIGKFDSARRAADDLRAEFGHASVRASIWIMLIEGLIAYFESLHLSSRDRILRALSLSRAAQIPDLQSLSATWLAHLEFNRQDFGQMKDALLLAAHSLASASPAAEIRFHMVVALAATYSRRLDSAKRHWEVARRIAVKLQDEASISALMYNRAAFALLNVRVNVALGAIDAQTEQFIDMEVASSYAYNSVVRHEALSYVLDIVRARLMLYRGKAEDAIRLFEIYLRDGKPLNFKSDDVVALLEYATCLADLNRRNEAVEILGSIDVRSSNNSLQSDDKVVFLSSYMRLCSLLGQDIDLTQVGEMFEAATAEYKGQVEKAADAIDAVLAVLE